MSSQKSASPLESIHARPVPHFHRVRHNPSREYPRHTWHKRPVAPHRSSICTRSFCDGKPAAHRSTASEQRQLGDRIRVWWYGDRDSEDGPGVAAARVRQSEREVPAVPPFRAKARVVMGRREHHEDCAPVKWRRPVLGRDDQAPRAC